MDTLRDCQTDTHNWTSSEAEVLTEYLSTAAVMPSVPDARSFLLTKAVRGGSTGSPCSVQLAHPVVADKVALSAAEMRACRALVQRGTVVCSKQVLLVLRSKV